MVTVNLNKAKVIGHVIRREMREAEFAPYDDIIAKRIPSMSEAEAEAARQAIRDKYAQIQSQIDTAETTDDIKAALGLTAK